MNNLKCFFFLLVFCVSCVNKVPQQNEINIEKTLSQVETLNYNQYLNELIKLELKFPIQKPDTVYFPICFYKVEPLVDASLYENDYSNTIALLNSEFKSALIQFYEVKENKSIYISANLDLLFYNEYIENQVTENFYNPSVINIYVMTKTDNVLGYTHYPDAENQKLFIAEQEILSPAIIHEMGHFFGLLHTFDNDHEQNILPNKFCEFEGDKICDTANDIAQASFIASECQLFGIYKNKNGEQISPDLHNYMSYYGECRNTFSKLQQKRMHFIAKKIKWPQIMRPIHTIAAVS
jgi:predicted Zn-dependent protease